MGLCCLGAGSGVLQMGQTGLPLAFSIRSGGPPGLLASLSETQSGRLGLMAPVIILTQQEGQRPQSLSCKVSTFHCSPQLRPQPMERHHSLWEWGVVGNNASRAWLGSSGTLGHVCSSH